MDFASLVTSRTKQKLQQRKWPRHCLNQPSKTMLMEKALFEKWLYSQPPDRFVDLHNGDDCVASSFIRETQGCPVVRSTWMHGCLYRDYAQRHPHAEEAIPDWFQMIIHQNRPQYQNYRRIQDWFQVIFPQPAEPTVLIDHLLVPHSLFGRERPAGRVRDQRLVGDRASTTRRSPKMRHNTLAAKRRPRTTSPRLAQRSPHAPAPASQLAH